MSTQTFKNLAEEKKNKIISASILEFSKFPFPDASINRIIKSADISRGSFYMYFQDKYDLLMYLLEIERHKLVKSMQKIMDSDIINLENIILAIHTHFYLMFEDKTLQDFYKNVIIFFQGRPIEEIRRIQHKIPIINGFEQIYRILDKSQFKFPDKDSIVSTIDIGMGIFKTVMFQSMIKNLSYDESQELLKTYLKIFKQGYGKEQ